MAFSVTAIFINSLWGNPRLFRGAIRSVGAQIPRILAWLDPAALKKRLVESIDKFPQPTLALSGKARGQKLLAIEAELLVCERRGSFDQAEEGGGPVVIRRLNADPQAVLNVALGRGPAVKAEAKAERVA